MFTINYTIFRPVLTIIAFHTCAQILSCQTTTIQRRFWTNGVPFILYKINMRSILCPLVTVTAFAVVALSQGNCLRKGFPRLDVDAQDVEVDLPVPEINHDGLADLEADVPVDQRTSSVAAMITPSRTMRLIPPTPSHSTSALPNIVNATKRWEALVDPSFARRYVEQEYNEWAFRVAGNSSLMLDPCSDAIAEPVGARPAQARPPLVAWARLREDTVPALPIDILHRLEQYMATDVFAVHYVFPPSLLSDILQDLPLHSQSLSDWYASANLDAYVFDMLSSTSLRRPPEEIIRILNDPINGAGADINLASIQTRSLVSVCIFLLSFWRT